MKKAKGRKTPKGSSAVNKKTRKVKVEARRLLSSAKKKLNKLTSKSSKRLRNAKEKVYATEKEMMAYVKANPVKSASAVALVGLIAGFVAKYNKGR